VAQQAQAAQLPGPEQEPRALPERVAEQVERQQVSKRLPQVSPLLVRAAEPLA
jgi:hypothetical protein